jgi:pimeloyl-ACP methyl ester carboxylesterase
VLVPGTLCDARVFEGVRARWHATAPDRVTIDLSLHDLTEDIGTWWAQQLSRLPGRFDLMGFSLGGVLALQLLALGGPAAQRVRRLVLVASNALPGTPEHRQRVQAQADLWQSAGPMAVADQMLAGASRAPHVPGQVPWHEQVRAMAASTPTAAFLAQGELNATRPDGRPGLAAWSGPVCLISGALDAWCGADKQAIMLAARPDSLWHELPDCGHYVPLEQAQAMADLAHPFLLSSSPEVRSS